MRETLHPLRILVVDDHHPTVITLRRLLMKEGHFVRTAESVIAAIDIADREAFDLLLCDIGLPDSNGYSLLARLRAHSPIAAVAITGNPMPAEPCQTRGAGFDHVLIKPVDYARLRAVVGAVGKMMQLRRRIDEIEIQRRCLLN